MGATYFHDPGAKDRSPMLRQLTLCNGQQTGHECQHYWRQVVRKDVLNPENLRKGETLRYCKVAMSAPDHGMAMFINGDTEMAVECTEYRKDRSRPFNLKTDDYDPLTPDEITALQEGRAIPRFQPRRWWEFWKPRPRVVVEWLTPEQIAAEAQKSMEKTIKTADPEGAHVLKGDVLQGSVLTSETPSDSTPSTDDKGTDK